MKNKHRQCIKILEGIEHFERMKQVAREQITATKDLFPQFTKKYLNKIDTYDRCINKLHKKYLKTLADIRTDEYVCSKY